MGIHMKKLVVLAKFSRNIRHKILSAIDGQLEVVFADDWNSDQNRNYALETAHIIIGEPEMEHIQNNQNLEWVQMTWAGTDKYT